MLPYLKATFLSFSCNRSTLLLFSKKSTYLNPSTPKRYKNGDAGRITTLLKMREKGLRTSKIAPKGRSNLYLAINWAKLSEISSSLSGVILLTMGDPESFLKMYQKPTLHHLHLIRGDQYVPEWKNPPGEDV